LTSAAWIGAQLTTIIINRMAVCCQSAMGLFWDANGIGGTFVFPFIRLLFIRTECCRSMTAASH